MVATAQRYFAGRRDLVLLQIETHALLSELRWEEARGGEGVYPHVCGPLNMEAVSAVLSFKPAQDGRFSLPRELR